MHKLQAISIIILLLFASCKARLNRDKTAQIVGGPCEGCEAVYEYDGQELSAIDTLPGYFISNPKIKLEGTIFENDGITPADNVIVYIYHTNRKGLYESKAGANGWAQRHGDNRGWIKTDKTGRYTFYTFRPASYPDRSEPEHIHVTIKEANLNEYYIDAFVFEDDPLLTAERRENLENRAGSGIVFPQFRNGIFTLKRDIILGLNIPNYR